MKRKVRGTGNIGAKIKSIKNFLNFLEEEETREKQWIINARKDYEQIMMRIGFHKGEKPIKIVDVIRPVIMSEAAAIRTGVSREHG